MKNLVQIGLALAKQKSSADLFVVDNEMDLREILRPTAISGQKSGFTSIKFNYPLIYSPQHFK